jgi:hypothetical protein
MKTKWFLVGTVASLLIFGLMIGKISLANRNLLLSSLGYALAQIIPRPSTCQGSGAFVPHSYRGEAISITPTQGLAVFYSAQCSLPGRPPTDMVGYRLYEGLNEAGETQFTNNAAVSGSSQPVTYNVGGTLGKTGYTLVWGQVLTSTVAMIEVAFGDGQTQVKSPSNNGYILIASGAVTPCKLRVLDNAQNELAQYDLSHYISSAVGLTGSCPP